MKKKYSGDLVANWVESTDPKKHVFEDLAVAAFLIELWNARYKDKPFESGTWGAAMDSSCTF